MRLPIRESIYVQRQRESGKGRLAKGQKWGETVPRYFFNVVDGVSKTLMGDPEGVVLSDLSGARREAVGWARDFARHNFRESLQAWKVIVTDENANVVLTIALSEVRPGRLTRACLALGRCISRRGSHIMLLSLAVAIVAVLVQAGVKTATVNQTTRGYELASATVESTVLAVRFVPNASLVEIAKFLDTYKASLFDGPAPGGFYKLRVGTISLPQKDMKSLIDRMAKETVVEFVAAVQ